MKEQDNGTIKGGPVGLLELAAMRLETARAALENLRHMGAVIQEAQARERDKVKRLAWSLTPVWTGIEKDATAAANAGDFEKAAQLSALGVAFRALERAMARVAGPF
jgi:hypothetical protein